MAMANDSERLLFRLNHIIPKSLSLINEDTNKKANSIPVDNGPQEVFFQMTWGKIAGRFSVI